VNIIINPGTSNVYGAELEDAETNMQAWITEIPDYKSYTCKYSKKKTENYWHQYPDMARGRFTFDVTVHLKDGRHFAFEVEMPGLPLDKVRYVSDEGQNIWDFPRLYVDGSSWVWEYSFSDFEPDDE